MGEPGLWEMQPTICKVRYCGGLQGAPWVSQACERHKHHT